MIAIDEATQLHKNYLKDLHKKLNGLKENYLPFGEISIILSGGLKQTSPIVIKSHQFSQTQVFDPDVHPNGIVPRQGGCCCNHDAGQMGKCHVSLLYLGVGP